MNNNKQQDAARKCDELTQDELKNVTGGNVTGRKVSVFLKVDQELNIFSKEQQSSENSFNVTAKKVDLGSGEYGSK